MFFLQKKILHFFHLKWLQYIQPTYTFSSVLKVFKFHNIFSKIHSPRIQFKFYFSLIRHTLIKDYRRKIFEVSSFPRIYYTPSDQKYLILLLTYFINLRPFFYSLFKKSLLEQQGYLYNVYKTNIFLLNLLFFNVKWIFLALIISGLYFFISLFYIQIDFTQQIALWYVVLVIFYLLISTFNSFLIKYKYGKFTSAIQRFWKRTGITFWLIEGFLFLLFFYYFLNSSQEPLYMFDFNNLNQEFLLQLKSSYRNLIILSLCIYLSFILILNNNFLNYYQNIVILSIISFLIFYMLFIESYQFVYIITLFSENNWILEEESEGLVWLLDLELSNIRVKQQYFILCLVAKYWHFIFIFISWFFFLIKCIEVNKINYTLMGYNIQNLIILYILNLCCLVQWFKWVFKKFLEITYYWFHISYDEKILFFIKNEIFNIFYSFFNLNHNLSVNINFKIISNSLYFTNSINLWKYI